MTEDRIKQLEAEIVRLKAMLSRAGVSILPSADLPNDEELDRLLRMVEAAYPKLRPINKEQFARAIHFLVYVYRVEKPNTLYATTFWIDGAREWFRSQGISSEMTLKPFVAAALASNIVFAPLDEFPFGVDLGINLGSASKPSSAWRDVLRNGIRPPVEPRNRASVRVQNIDVVLR